MVIELIRKHHLDAVQLHGSESAEYCSVLKKRCDVEQSETSNNDEIPAKAGMTEVIKVFSIKDHFNFEDLQPYEDIVDYYLFDTKGKHHGGNGYAFNWEVLKNYPSTKPYFLSGGIGLEEADNVLSFLNKHESKYCYAIDINSKFEIEPGFKDIEKLERFKNIIKT